MGRGDHGLSVLWEQLNHDYGKSLYRDMYRDFLYTCPFNREVTSFDRDWGRAPLSPIPKWGSNADPFITELDEESMYRLGLDILEHGTYFPIFKKGDSLVEGFHRVDALKECKRMGLNFNKYLMAVDISEDGPISVKAMIPNIMYFHDGLVQTTYKEYGLEAGYLKEHQYEYSQVEIKSKWQWYKVHQLYSTACRRYLYEFDIEPLKEVNP
jgi:hypothetical protein